MKSRRSGYAVDYALILRLAIAMGIATLPSVGNQMAGTMGVVTDAMDGAEAEVSLEGDEVDDLGEEAGSQGESIGDDDAEAGRATPRKLPPVKFPARGARRWGQVANRLGRNHSHPANAAWAFIAGEQPRPTATGSPRRHEPSRSPRPRLMPIWRARWSRRRTREIAAPYAEYGPSAVNSNEGLVGTGLGFGETCERARTALMAKPTPS